MSRVKEEVRWLGVALVGLALVSLIQSVVLYRLQGRVNELGARTWVGEVECYDRPLSQAEIGALVHGELP